MPYKRARSIPQCQEPAHRQLWGGIATHLTTCCWDPLSAPCMEPSCHLTALFTWLISIFDMVLLQARCQRALSFLFSWQDLSISLVTGLRAASGSCKQSRPRRSMALGYGEVIFLTGFSCPLNICAVTRLWKICEWVSLDSALSQMGHYTAHITKPSAAV